MSKNNDEGSYVTIAGKISTYCFGRLQRLLSKRGINTYQMVQNSAAAMVRHMDDQHNLTPENEKVIGVFEGMVGWEDNFNLADPQGKPEVCEAIYFMNDQNGKKGIVPVDVERPFFGQWRQTYNVQVILDKFLRMACPYIWRRLDFIRQCRQCASIYELMLDVLGELERQEQDREIQEEFADNDRGDFGQKPGSTHYRRKMAKTPDMFQDELKVES